MRHVILMTKISKNDIIERKLSYGELFMIYVISSKNIYAAQRLLKEARIMNYELRILDVNDLLHLNFKTSLSKRDVLYIRNPYLKGGPKYIPNIIKLAKEFRVRGGRVVDANITKGQIGKGKWVDYQMLKKAGLSIPRTLKYESPFCQGFGGPVGIMNDDLNYPLILKWIYGMKAKGTFLIQNEEQFKKTVKLHPSNEWLIQEYIKAKYEYKIICVGYKALPVVLRFEFNTQLGRADFDSNSLLSLEGEDRVRGNSKIKKLIEVAEKASKILGRELSKVDILEDHSGKLYVLEVNRFPGLKSFEQLTQYNVAKEFLNYLIFPNQHLPKE